MTRRGSMVRMRSCIAQRQSLARVHVHVHLASRARYFGPRVYKATHG